MFYSKMLSAQRITPRVASLAVKRNLPSALSLAKYVSTFPREIHMTFGNNKRMIKVTANDSASLEESFIYTFRDVIPANVRKFQFQQYREDVEDFIDIIHGETIEHVRWGRALVLISVAVEPGKVYKVWSLASNKGSGYLRRRDGKVNAKGNGAGECEWLVKEGKQTASVNYYRFLSRDEKQTLCVHSNQEIDIKDPNEVQDLSDNFVPDPLPESNLYSVLKPYSTLEHKLYLGSDGRGNVKLFKMEDFQNNPAAEALFVFHRIES